MTGTATVTILPLPTAGTISGPTSVATGSVITLTDGTSGGTWSSSNTHATVGSTGVVTGVSAGSVTISYAVTNSCGTAYATHAITETGGTAREAYAAGATEICVGSSEVLPANATAGGVWSSNDNNIATVDAQSGLVTGVSVGTTQISYIVSDISGSATTVVTPVIIVPLPDYLVISAKPGTSIAAGQQLTLTAAVNNGSPVLSYQWMVNDVVIAGANSATYSSIGFANNDAVSCVVTGACGNVALSKTVVVTVANESIQQIPGGGEIRVVPNPNNGLFTITGTLGTTGDEAVSLEITDVLGQVIYKTRVTAHGGAINETVQLGKAIANGMYLLNVNTDTVHKVFHVVVEQ
jgi:hypothetical protein